MNNCDSTWKFEDIIVAILANLSLILIAEKNLRLNPNIENTLTLSLGCVIIFFIVLAKLKLIFFSQDKSFNGLFCLFFKHHQKNIYRFFGIFIFCLIRAFLKAQNFNQVEYIPSRYNTDIFLYLRRISIFLGSDTPLNHQYNGIKAIDILYDSPKLLSSFIYAIFTQVFHHPGLAGTILTSLILSAIYLKYILLIMPFCDRNKILCLALISFILLQPTLSWLQDQFYLSNLLYIYLLIYTVEDFFVSQFTPPKIFLKFALASLAVAGFYPSQLPFLALTTVILILLTEHKISLKIIDALKILVITTITILLFISQYTNTTEVSQHFNLTDATHGINFVYIPFWSLFSVVPKPGGFKIGADSIFLLIASIALSLITTKYLISKKLLINHQYLYLTALLYLIYSISFVIFPGSYRQGKFFVSYIIPLALFCFLKVLAQTKSKQIKIITASLVILVIYISYNSLTRQYKSYIPRSIQPIIEKLKDSHQPIVIYYDDTEHKYYYLSYQLRDNQLFMHNHCPSLAELTKDTAQKRAIAISKNCRKNSVSLINSNIIPILENNKRLNLLLGRRQEAGGRRSNNSFILFFY